MKDKLFEILEVCETKELAQIFKNYMESIGVKKLDKRKKDRTNTYSIHGDCTNWNRVSCYHHKETTEYSEENLDITLRKRAGYYFIIGKKGKRAFERSYGSLVHYDEELFNEIIEEHKPLFDELIRVTFKK